MMDFSDSINELIPVPLFDFPNDLTAIYLGEGQKEISGDNSYLTWLFQDMMGVKQRIYQLPLDKEIEFDDQHVYLIKLINHNQQPIYKVFAKRYATPGK